MAPGKHIFSRSGSVHSFISGLCFSVCDLSFTVTDGCCGSSKQSILLLKKGLVCCDGKPPETWSMFYLLVPERTVTHTKQTAENLFYQLESTLLLLSVHLLFASYFSDYFNEMQINHVASTLTDSHVYCRSLVGTLPWTSEQGSSSVSDWSWENLSPWRVPVLISSRLALDVMSLSQSQWRC